MEPNMQFSPHEVSFMRVVHERRLGLGHNPFDDYSVADLFAGFVGDGDQRRIPDMPLPPYW
jgi:hypothetical protein